MSDIVTVLTFKSVEEVLEVGGTQSWALDRKRAASCDYVVLCRNSKTRHSNGPEEHGTAFMVGKVKDVVPSTDIDGRWLILMSEYALIDVLDQWEGRNPVSYWKDSDYDENDINFKTLVFQPLEGRSRGLTIAQAKAGLSLGLDVPESAIEIVVRS